MNNKIHDMVLISLITAVSCVFAPMSLPVGPVPISLATLIFYFSIYILGAKRAFISCGIYIIIGLCGLPVLSGFSGGIAKLAGPTGGYIIGYLFMIAIAGIIIDNFSHSKVMCFLGMLLGTAALYFVGTIWFIYIMDVSVKVALIQCVIIFIPGDIIKMALAVMVAPMICSRLKMAEKKNSRS